MVDFAALPPEINSARMYAGVGAAPLAAAAQAWDGLAAELGSAAELYAMVVAELVTRQWVGPSAVSMAEAAASYLSWLNATAGLAAQTAGQLRSAVAAYEAAYVATVPPAEIEVNRALLAALVATNVFGQNSSAIAATETQYGQMWAQDGAAMYSYAGASAAATTLTPFTAPAQNADPAAQPTLAQVIAQISSVPNLLQGLASGTSVDPIALLDSMLADPANIAVNRFGSDMGQFATELSGWAFLASGFTPYFSSLYPLALPAQAAADVAEVSSAAPGPTLVSSYGDAASVGRLSVPATWSMKAPEIRLAATQLPASALGSLPQAAILGPDGCGGGLPVVSGLGNAAKGGESKPRCGVRSKVLPPWAREPDAEGQGSGRPHQSQPVASALSDRERDEIARLRKEIAELATERDAAARLIKEAMW
ncbi:PPE family protein [Mycobacterium szulgai]|nr:PPE family protein [Mycobacterium szulgai]